jgi:hypothetical protein
MHVAAVEEGGVAAAPAVEVSGRRWNRRHPRRPDWPPACASSIGGMATRPTHVCSHAAGRETARLGATKCGCPWRPAPCGRCTDWPQVPG